MVCVPREGDNNNDPRLTKKLKHHEKEAGERRLETSCASSKTKCSVGGVYVGGGEVKRLVIGQAAIGRQVIPALRSTDLPAKSWLGPRPLSSN